MSNRVTIFFSAGEPSGDLHAANLVRAIRGRVPEAQFVGYGGPRMAAAGCQLHADLTSLAVMWFARALLNLHRFWDLASRADRYFAHHPPDAVVLVDYPGFNWWIARRAKAHGIPVFYYSPPQIWAWASWRVRKMRRFVDHVLCSLPFEESWLRERGCHATYIGHPFFDDVRERPIDCEFRERYRQPDRPLLVILPGSRNQEIELNLAGFLRTAAIVLSRFPTLKIAIAAFRPRQAERARQMVAASGLDVDVFVNKTPELMQLADCCLATSGSVSLELLYYGKPTVIGYRISPLAYKVQEQFRHVKYITLVNLLAAKELYPADLSPYDSTSTDADEALFPEYLRSSDCAQQMAGHLMAWLGDPEQHGKLVARLGELCDRVGQPGATRRAAEYIVGKLRERQPSVPRPHFLPGMVVPGTHYALPERPMAELATSRD
ncbi:MAG: lipid-A-disaccharide synthase [Pirellulales bacterium]|nr:lipid-A-disaccharide synthase [Pirellulales bacterium]